MQSLKTLARNALPARYQVPIKYWYGRMRGDLEPEMTLLPLLVSRGARVLDIGGNRGTYAYALWCLGARVEVFEPNPECAGILRAWASGTDRVEIHGVALSSHAGVALLHVPVDECGIAHDASASIEKAAAGEGRSIDLEVALRPLDSFGFNDASLVKIDVEGHELGVIEGAGGTLEASKPALIIEIEQRHNQRPIREIFARIQAFGYDGFFLLDGKLRPIEAFDLERHQAIEAFTARSVAYHNNFLFLHRHRIEGGEYRRLLDRFGR